MSDYERLTAEELASLIDWSADPEIRRRFPSTRLIHRALCELDARRAVGTSEQLTDLRAKVATARERMELLTDTLIGAEEVINYTGDILNNMDAVESQDEDFVTPRMEKVREVLNQPSRGVDCNCHLGFLYDGNITRRCRKCNTPILDAALGADAVADDIQRTHHAECWRDPRHHGCAVARIEAIAKVLKMADFEGTFFTRISLSQAIESAMRGEVETRTHHDIFDRLVDDNCQLVPSSNFSEAQLDVAEKSGRVVELGTYLFVIESRAAMRGEGE
jgi:hypothetical protein